MWTNPSNSTARTSSKFTTTSKSCWSLLRTAETPVPLFITGGMIAKRMKRSISAIVLQSGAGPVPLDAEGQ
jgi:hypothetical protein